MPLRMPDDQAQRTEPPRATLRLPQNATAGPVRHSAREAQRLLGFLRLRRALTLYP
jgi:hypothetical protein